LDGFKEWADGWAEDGWMDGGMGGFKEWVGREMGEQKERVRGGV
jgi:hypothetical protein